MDNERWKQADVPAEFQDLVNSIAGGRIALPERKVPGSYHGLSYFLQEKSGRDAIRKVTGKNTLL